MLRLYKDVYKTTKPDVLNLPQQLYSKNYRKRNNTIVTQAAHKYFSHVMPSVNHSYHSSLEIFFVSTYFTSTIINGIVLKTNDAV